MGSFCKSGPSKTETTQNYTPAGAAQMRDIYSRVSEAASTPYTAYGGQMVSPLNNIQYGGIDKITGATDYLNDARAYADSSASPITEGEIARYYNPFQRDVVDATMANFQQGNAVQDERLKGDAISAGAWGGDRAGIARAELARTQKLAQDPVIAGLNQNGYLQALQAAQADRAARGQAGYQMSALHNAALAGGQSQIGAGSLVQGTEQQRLNALYQEFLRQQQHPYQNAQFLAQYGMPALSGMGGSQTGTSTHYAAQPSMMQQIIGAGTAIGGMMMGNPFAAMGGMGALGAGQMGAGIGGSSYSIGYGGQNVPVFANRGGRLPRYSRGGGIADRVHAFRTAMRRGGGLPGYDAGGGLPFMSRFQPALDAIYGGEFDPQGGNYLPEDAMAAAPSSVPLPPARPPMSIAGLPPEITNPGGGGPIMMPPGAMAFSGDDPSAGGIGSNLPPQARSPMMRPPMMLPQSGTSTGISEEARLGLIAAGLGILGSKAPNAFSAIGEGGLAGIRVYAQGKESRQRNETAARKMLLDAEQFAQGLDLRERTLKETERYHRDTIDERRRAAQERSEDRDDAAARAAYPGEGQDEKGNTVKGLYQYNPKTREYEFKPGKIIHKGATGGDRSGQTERLIAELRKENPLLSYQDALALTKRAPNADQATLRRESLALSAAKADMEYLSKPEATLEKWRKQYGLEGSAAGTPAPAAPGAKPSEKRSDLKPMPPGVLAKAKEAIAAGKDRKAVEARVREWAQQNGVEFSGL